MFTILIGNTHFFELRLKFLTECFLQELFADLYADSSPVLYANCKRIEVAFFC